MRKFHVVSAIFTSLLLLILFQNCNKVQIAAVDTAASGDGNNGAQSTPDNTNTSPGGSSGSGTGAGGTGSGNGGSGSGTGTSPLPIAYPVDPSQPKNANFKRLAIWLDKQNDGIARPENFLGFVFSFKGTETAAKNYNYYSDSAHPVVGPAPQGFLSHIFFYEEADGKMYLNFYFNIDNGGSSNNKVDIDFITSGNNAADNVVLSDDSGELKGGSASADGVKTYQGRFQYWSNTDGGVIGPFSGTNFKIRGKVISTGDVNGATFHSVASESFSLASEASNINSFIIQFAEQ